MGLVLPHGGGELKPLLLEGEARQEKIGQARGYKTLEITSREARDCFMLGIGAFTPLTGFMGRADWHGVCSEMRLDSGLFWPMPITVSCGDADGIEPGDKVALVSPEYGGLVATMDVREKYQIDKQLECLHVFSTDEAVHPGVAKVMAQKKWNLAGPVSVVSEGGFPEEYGQLYARPAQTRALFQQMGWSRVAAFQTNNPMHRSHEYLVKIAVEVMDGVLVHQELGRLKAGDIPIQVRVRAINALLDNYFVRGTVVSKGYPMEMRHGGPREALLHAVFRQNFGCSHLIVGRDHAGVGDYYGPFDAQKIFQTLPEGSLELRPLTIDWTFYCDKCEGMASMKTCPHGKEHRLLLSGTMVCKTLSEGGEPPREFSRPEVLEVLRDYYQSLDGKVDI
ncbi:MAG: sulfate adenylyltransferase [Proteobacteria bacterium]|nr:sulfate adenylyltransferase [Pseudomonadota bacterium]MBU1452619.1 sulfate adenylyltransferase [Pseudomonadota bacterium]MBU2467769.1 sulfate adenylyltransferase [Pseudomonadota bacterium]